MCTTSHTFQCGHAAETDEHTTCGQSSHNSCVSRSVKSYEGECKECRIHNWLIDAVTSIALPSERQERGDVVEEFEVEWSY